MPPPTNQTITTAIDLGSSWPLSYTQQQDDGGVTYPCWWFFDVPAGINEVSGRVYGDFSTWVPGVTFWRGPTGSPSLATGGGGSDVWNQVPVTPGERIYIKSQKRSVDVVPAISHVEVVLADTQLPVRGDIVHPDSSLPYPATILDPDTEEVKGFINPFPFTGTTGVIRSSGLVAIYDFDADAVKILDVDLNVVFTPALPFHSPGYIIATDGVTGWWCIKRGIGSNNSQAYFVDLTGTITRGPYDMGIESRALEVAAPNPANTILYWAETSQQGQPGKPIYQVNLDTLIVSDFLAGTADDLSYWLSDILCMSDGSVIVSFQTNAGAPNRFITGTVIRRYSDAAVLLNEWDIFPEIAAPVWLFSALDDPLSFWAFCVGTLTASFPNSQPWNKYFHFVVANANVPVPIQKFQFIEGVSQEPGNLNAEQFGTDWGSSPWIHGAALPVIAVPETETIAENPCEDCKEYTLRELTDMVKRRIGDPSSRVWTEDEIVAHIKQGYRVLSHTTHAMWDQLYLPDFPYSFSFTQPWEEAYLDDSMLRFGVANYTFADEFTYFRDDISHTSTGLANQDDWLGPGVHTNPDELNDGFLVGLSTDPRIPALVEMPGYVAALERAVWDDRHIEALDPVQISRSDSRYELTRGEVFGYTWQKDGVRKFRKIRVPARIGNSVQVDNAYGVPRLDGAEYNSEIEGNWGTVRIIPDRHPIGWFHHGAPKGWYEDEINVKTELFRFGRPLDTFETKVELPGRYAVYLRHYALAMCLRRQGPGHNIKLSSHFMSRWNVGIARIMRRAGRMDPRRIGRMGGASPLGRQGPPRPKLPWQFGQRLR